MRRSRLIGPAVRLLQKKYGLSVNQIGGTGPHGNVSKGDVLKYVTESNLRVVPQDAALVSIKTSNHSVDIISNDRLTSLPKLRPRGPSPFTDIEISNKLGQLAQQLLQSKSTVPHAYGIIKCNIGKLSIIRKQLASENIKVSQNDVIIKCTANALLKVPAVNCIWDKENKLHQRNIVDIAVRVTTPSGLMLPIISGVGEIDVVQISKVVKILAAKAKDRKLKPHELLGGPFSISNLGKFGITSFSEIIIPPQTAALAIGDKFVTIDEQKKPITVVQLQLSYDARAISEKDSAKFLGVLKNEIENVSEPSLGIFDMLFMRESLDVL